MRNEDLLTFAIVLAGDSKTVEPSPDIPPTARARTAINNEIDIDDGPDPPRPRLSLPINEDEDSFEMPAPRLSAPLEDENNTQQSVELPRRALNEQPSNRYSRGSFGSIRTSDRFSDFNELGLGEGPEEADLTLGQDFGDSEMLVDEQEEDDFDPKYVFGVAESQKLTRHGSNISITQGLQQAFFEEANRQSLEGEELPDIQELEESLFEFDVPARLEEPETFLSSPMATARSETPLVPVTTETSRGARPFVQPQIAKQSKPQERVQKAAVFTRHGLSCPSIPAGVVKKVASTFLKSSGKGQSQMNKETLKSIMQATDWFFEQISEDLESYAAHAGRKTIDESDVTTLMKRYVMETCPCSNAKIIQTTANQRQHDSILLGSETSSEGAATRTANVTTTKDDRWTKSDDS
jgi:histone H3/H4